MAPGPKDLLPQPPWEGPPIPRGLTRGRPRWDYLPVMERSFIEEYGWSATTARNRLLAYSESLYHPQILLFFQTLDIYTRLAFPETSYMVTTEGLRAVMLALEPYMIRYAQVTRESAEFYKGMSEEEQRKAIWFVGSREETVAWCEYLAQRLPEIFRKAREEERTNVRLAWVLALDELMHEEHAQGGVIDGALWEKGWRDGKWLWGDIQEFLGSSVLRLLDELAGKVQGQVK